VKNMNKLEDYFWNKSKKLSIHKWHHYFDIYDRHFKKFIGKNPTILEIGVAKGGSLEMWNHYFENECHIFGIDINTSCLDVPESLGSSNIQVEIGNQEDRGFWKTYLADKPKFDIVIDDGGHMMKQQIVTYEEVYDHVSDDGVYLCEDLHTSYWAHFGGGLRHPMSFIEYSKHFVDMLNYYHIHNQPEPQKYEKFRKYTNSIHYYDSIIVLEKAVDLERPVATVRA